MYSPLPDPRSIRLLTIQPGASPSIIQVSLHVINLDTAPEFEALSYFWGPKDHAAEILCDGEIVGVTPNLGAALHRLRYQDKMRVMWIDALCINQNDLDERSQQVSFMNDIYAAARHVVAWLGPDNGLAELAISLISIIYEHVTEECEVEEHVLGKKAFIIKYGTEASDMKCWSRLPLVGDPEWDAILWIYSRPWFSRIWVIQEITQDPDAKMLIGDLSVPWKVVGVAAHWLLMKYPDANSRQFRGFALASHMWNIYYLGRDKSTMHELLEFLSIFESTEPRDKLYAIASLRNDDKSWEPKELIQPNYRKSIPEVFTDLVRWLISRPLDGSYGCLDILGTRNIYYGDHLGKSPWELKSNTTTSDSDFPSWVPRLEQTGYILRLSKKSRYAPIAWAASSGSPVGIGNHSVRDSLVLRGVRLTGVMTEYNPFDGVYENFIITNPDSSLHDKVSWLLRSISSDLPNLGGHDAVKQAFVSTIALGASEFAQEAFDLDGCLDANSTQKNHHENLLTVSLGIYALFTTLDGHLGLGVPMMPGDEIWLLFGGRVPYILRPNRDHYNFIGECYVYGYIYGEGMDLWEQDKLKDEWVDLR